MAVGAIEPQFYAELIRLLDLDPGSLPGQYDTARWPELRKVFDETFRSRTRDEWSAIFAGADACTTPVLTFAEARQHEHVRARGSLVAIDGIAQHRPAPRFSRTEPEVPAGPARSAIDPDDVWT